MLDLLNTALVWLVLFVAALSLMRRNHVFLGFLVAFLGAAVATTYTGWLASLTA